MQKKLHFFFNGIVKNAYRSLYVLLKLSASIMYKD